MSDWLLRGLAFAAAMVGLRLVQGALINTWQTRAGLISTVLMVLFVIGVLIWGLLDGRDDATANPDPDRRQDLAITWLAAGLPAGVLSGAVTWVISLVDKALYVGGLLNELTTFAAFTALAVFLPAMGGVVAGRALADRHYAKAPHRHHGLAAELDGRADTDVFAAVGAGAPAEASGAPAAAVTEAPTAPSGEAPAADWPTEEFPADTEQTTASTPGPSEESTATLPTEDDKPGYQSS